MKSTNPADAGFEGKWLPRYAKLVVAGIFFLLFLGGLVTSFGAGMAVPDWPTSFGAWNPTGWWTQLPVRLEHGHRMTAELVGVLGAVLCCWVWRRWTALFVAVALSAVLPPIAAIAGASKVAIMHLAIWPAAIAFVILILKGSGARVYRVRPSVRWAAFGLFCCICIQATLGGFRVTTETAGAIDVALIFRIAHGSFAQIFVLSLAVATAAMLSPIWDSVPAILPAKGLSKLAWVVFGALLLQLVVGATMRHMGAGLAIPSFPRTAPHGPWMPTVHNAAIDTNFTHTRVFALLVTILIVVLGIRVIRAARGERTVVRLAWAMLALVLIQVTLGVLVIQIQIPPVQGLSVQFISRMVEEAKVMDVTRALVNTIKTVHMLNGAITLAVSLLLALRLSRAASLSTGRNEGGENDQQFIKAAV